MGFGYVIARGNPLGEGICLFGEVHKPLLCLVHIEKRSFRGQYAHHCRNQPSTLII
jgi:hypothetical protein